MICSSCLAYNNNERTFCKSCGVRLEESGGTKQTKKPRYYCKRCRRHLISRICPMHGMEHMVSIDAPEPVQAEAGRGWEKATNNNGLRAAPLPPPRPQEGSLDILSDEAPRPTPNGAATPKIVVGREDPDDPPSSNRRPTLPADDAENAPGESIIDDDLQSTLRSLIEDRLESLRKERAHQPSAEPEPVPPKRKPAQPTAAPPTNGAPKQNSAPTQKEESRPPGSQPKTRLTNATGKAGPSTTRKKTPRKRRRLSALQLAAAVLTPVFLIALGVFLYAFLQPVNVTVNDAATIFSRAEQAWTEGNYSAASQLYLQVQTQYPEDPLATEAGQRISAISARQAEEMKRRDQVLQLMSGAAAAFSNEQFLTPPEESAVYYINQILQIDPNFQPAQKMREEIIDRYFDSARQAFESEDFKQAARFYQDILRITPNDPRVLDEMETALKAHSVQKMLDDLSRLANSQEELKQLQKEKYRLKTEVKAVQRKLSASSIQTASSPAELPRKGLLKPSTGARKPRPILSQTDQQPETIKTARPAKADPNAPLVEEDRIDGKKRYLSQPAPIIPAGLKGKSSGIILAECLVNTLGEVESVSIVSPSQEAGFNQLAERLLKLYRYKPATFRGKPVRFKAVEVLSF